MTREELHGELLQYDISIIPLLNRIYGSVPSKIFEYARLGIPMLYFGGGEGEDIINEFNLGWIAEPTNYEALNEVISSISAGMFTDDFRRDIQQSAITQFDFNKQLRQLEEVL